MSRETLSRTLALDNGQTLEIYDASRKIAEGTWLVKIIFKMDVKVEQSLFAEEELKTFSFEEITEALGTSAVFEIVKERNFIGENEKETLFNRLVEDHLDSTGGYLANPAFPKKLVIRKFLESRKNHFHR